MRSLLALHRKRLHVLAPPTHHPSFYNTKKYSQTFCKYFSANQTQDYENDSNNGTLFNVNKTDLEHLPNGIHRQCDFFGEAITFVKDVDRKSICSISTDNNIDDERFGGKVVATMQRPAAVSSSSPSHDNIIDATSSFDGMALCILSRGSANLHTGNDGDGPEARAFHSSAMAWNELLRYAWNWNHNNISSDNNMMNNDENNIKSPSTTTVSTAPMLAVAAVAPVLAQGGSHYIHRIDRLLNTTRDYLVDNSPPSLWIMAKNAVSFRDATLPTATSLLENNSTQDKQLKQEPIPHLLTPRERWHMHALYQLLHDNHQDAMGAYLRLLELYPGDLLGLSLALDVANTLGDTDAACRAATNVSAYWTERDGGALRIQQSHPAQNIAMSLISVGLSSSASSSRASTSERLAEVAMARDSDGTGGTSVWALSHCLASEGRSSEMTSKLAGFDGTQSYEACGYLHFNIRMKGYGGIALLDRKGAGADRSAIGKYDSGFGNILEYSGNDVKGLENGGEEICLREMRIPRSIKNDVAGAVGSMFTGWFSNNGDGTNKEGQPSNDTKAIDEEPKKLQRRKIEDVLCWLPPSPLLLTQATSLLLRLTLCDAIPESDDRWADLRAAWTMALDDADHEVYASTVEFMPMAKLASSLLIDPSEQLHLNKVSEPILCAMKGLHKMGELMKLGRSKMVTSTTRETELSLAEDWKEVIQLLACARDSSQRWEMPTGMSSSTYKLQGDIDTSPYIPSRPIGWDFDMRQFLEYPLCHAAMQVGDYESLCLARAICSEGTTLRSNCPEIWWRYSTVLDKLGDHVAAENARAASISLGSGEGGGTF